MPAETTELSDDDIFHILQTNRRRESMRFLLEQDGPVKMRDVAEYVAAREHDTTVAELTSTQRQRVYIPLYQSHLPKLDKEGIIEYDKSRGIVRPTERLRVFEPYLEAPNDATNGATDDDAEPDRSSETEPASEYYVTAIGASASLLVAAASGLLAIPGLILAAIIVTLFTLATVATTLPGVRRRTLASQNR